MLLLRLIFLVGPLLAVTFNTKSKESKKPELDEVLTKSLNDFDADIQRLQDEYEKAQNKLKSVGSSAQKKKKAYKRELDAAENLLNDAITRKKGMNNSEPYFLIHHIIEVSTMLPRF